MRTVKTMTTMLAAAVFCAPLALNPAAAVAQDEATADTAAEMRALREDLASMREAIEATRQMLVETRKEVAQIRDERGAAPAAVAENVQTNASVEPAADPVQAEREALAAERRALALERQRLQQTQQEVRDAARAEAQRYESLPRPSGAGVTYAPVNGATTPTYSDSRTVTRTYSTTTYAEPQATYGVTYSSYPAYTYTPTYYASSYYYPRYRYYNNYCYTPRYYRSYNNCYPRYRSYGRYYGNCGTIGFGYARKNWGFGISFSNCW